MILCIDGNSSIHIFLRTTLVANGYAYLKASTGEEGLITAVIRNPDLILLELGLPDLDGLEVISRLRKSWKKPIIVISERDSEKDKVAALEMGVDDYLTKPFSAPELMARISAALRRTQSASGPEKGQIYKYGDLKVDLAHRRVWRGKEEVYLTRREYILFATLVRYAGEVVTHRNLLAAIWGEAFVNQSHNQSVRINLRVLINQLRQKLETDSGKPLHFQSHYGEGYRLQID